MLRIQNDQLTSFTTNTVQTPSELLKELRQLNFNNHFE